LRRITRPSAGRRDLLTKAAMSRIASVALLAALLAGLCAAAGPPEQSAQLLVVTDSAETAMTHSRLLASLRDRGYHATIVAASSATAADLALAAPGAAATEYRYGGVLVLCPTAAGMAKKLSVKALGRFADRGGSLFVSGGGGHSAWLGQLAKAFGVDVDESSRRVIDHQRAVPGLDGGDRTWVTAGGRAASEHLFGAGGGDVVFHGPGASLFADNELIESVIWGGGSSYTGVPGAEVTALPHEAGSGTVLAAALSTRVGSRFVYFGSYDALGDAAFEAAGDGHAGALTHLAAWAFGHAGVLRARNLRYSTDRAGAAEDGFRVKDEISFAVDLQAWDGGRGAWGEYAADDVQLEFVMLNPWVRVRLAAVGNGDKSTYVGAVQVPDQIGIYKFRIAHHRTGVSGVEVQEVVPIRPFLHNEYRRFIPMAYPYYAACFLMLASVFLLGVALNYGNAAVSATAAADADRRQPAGVPAHPRAKRE
jgi:oligosaccharyltransferase complex subunit beta